MQKECGRETAAKYILSYKKKPIELKPKSGVYPNLFKDYRQNIYKDIFFATNLNIHTLNIYQCANFIACILKNQNKDEKMKKTLLFSIVTLLVFIVSCSRNPLEPEIFDTKSESAAVDGGTSSGSPSSGGDNVDSSADYAKMAALVKDYNESTTSSTEGSASIAGMTLSSSGASAFQGRDRDVVSGLEQMSVLAVTTNSRYQSNSGCTVIVFTDDKGTVNREDDWQTITYLFDPVNNVVKKHVISQPCTPALAWNVWNSEGEYREPEGAIEYYENNLKIRVGTSSRLWKKKADNTIHLKQYKSTSGVISVNNGTPYAYTIVTEYNENGKQITSTVTYVAIRTDGSTVVKSVYTYFYDVVVDGLSWTKTVRETGDWYLYRRIDNSIHMFKMYNSANQLINWYTYSITEDSRTGDKTYYYEYFDAAGKITRTAQYVYSYNYSQNGVQVKRTFNDGKPFIIVIHQQNDGGFKIVKDGNIYTAYIVSNGFRLVDKHGKTTTVTMNSDGTYTVITGNSSKKITV